MQRTKKNRAFNPFQLKTVWINDKEFIANPQDENSLLELTRFNNNIAPKLSTYFSERGEGYWYFLNYFLYANFWFLRWPGLEFCLALIRALEDCESGKTITIESNNPLGPTVAANIPHILPNAKIEIKGRKRKRCNPVLDNQFVLKQTIKTRIAINYFLGLLRRAFGIGRKGRKNDAKVLFLENVRFINEKTDKNQLFDKIQQLLRKQKITQKSITYAPLPEKVYLKRFIRHFLFDQRPFIGDYLRPHHFKENKQFVKKMKILWKRADADPAFRKLFHYRGKDFYQLIRPRFKAIVNSFAYAAAENRSITKAILKKEKFQILVIDHEENQYAKGIMLNAKNDKKRKIVALSHELLYPGSIQTRGKDAATNDRRSVAWRPLVDEKYLWSKSLKQIAINKINYPKKCCIVTGNPRIDHVFERNFDKKNIFQKYKLNPQGKHILMVTTIENRSMDLHARIARDNPDYVWLIKPHPSEDMISLTERFKKAKPPKNLLLCSSSANTYELMEASKAVMGMSSSVILEAAAIGKPIIIFNPDHLTEKDMWFVPYKEALCVNTPEELPNALKTLENPKKRTALLKRLRIFADKFNYKHDGKSSNRIASRISRLLN